MVVKPSSASARNSLKIVSMFDLSFLGVRHLRRILKPLGVMLFLMQASRKFAWVCKLMKDSELFL